MSQLTEKSLHTLELPLVLARVARHAASDEAKERIQAARPTNYLPDAQLWQKQTSAARSMMGLRPAPSFSGLKPVGASLSRAELGGTLNTRELLDIAAVLRLARGIRDYGLSGKDRPGTVEDNPEAQPGCLDILFKLLQGNRFLEDKITNAIISEEEISDNASSELFSIRRHLRLTQNRVRETLNKYITSPSYTKYLQDTLITQRGGRFVIPVKSEHRGDVPGMVHDVSSSGATFFIEPMPVVNLNNELRELEAKEKKEIERILAELSADCADFADSITRDYGALIELDVIFARGKFSYELDAMEPALNDRGRLSFITARHPLLDPKTAVPISVQLGRDFDTLVITGPNTGGKTVTLKTIGLLSLMAACGLHLPVGAGSEAPVWNAVYADIGDEQSIEQSLSTFSSHMTTIVGVLTEAGPGSLVLFDELGAGTDPVEGAALAVSIIQHTRGLGACIAATTHYAELKSFALTTDGVENASCEFNVETLQPTYKLLIGIPGKSNAFAISRRLGLTDSIIVSAQEQVSTDNVAFEDVLHRLEQQRQALERERTEVEVLLRQAEEDRRKSAELRNQLEAQRDKNVQRAQSEARRIIEEARAESDEILRELRRMQAQGVSNEDIGALRARLNAAEDKVLTKDEIAAPAHEPIKRALKPGDTVRIVSMNIAATVLEPPDKDGQVQLLAGIMKVKLPVSDLTLAEAEAKKPKPGHVTGVKRSDVPMECDLRGQTTEEAIMAMEQYIDNAVIGGRNLLTIIHGKGTGALRAAVQKALRQNKHVATFRLGRYGEGDGGVTIVELKGK